MTGIIDGKFTHLNYLGSVGPTLHEINTQITNKLMNIYFTTLIVVLIARGIWLGLICF